MIASRPCLLLHGFTGGPFEVRPLADYLNARGWVCDAPALPGHEGQLRELHRFPFRSWIQEAEAAAERLTAKYGPIDLVGFSMGGLIAAHVANRFPVRRLVLLNAAVYYVSPSRWVRNAKKVWKGERGRPAKEKRDTPLGAVIEFMKLVRALKPELACVTTPTFVAQGEQDEVVHPMSAHYIAGQVRGKVSLAMYPRSRHLICMEPDAPLLFRHVESFFQRGGNS